MCNFKIETLLLPDALMFRRQLPGDKWLLYGLHDDDYLWKIETSWKRNVSIV